MRTSTNYVGLPARTYAKVDQIPYPIALITSTISTFTDSLTLLYEDAVALIDPDLGGASATAVGAGKGIGDLIKVLQYSSFDGLNDANTSLFIRSLLAYVEGCGIKGALNDDPDKLINFKNPSKDIFKAISPSALGITGSSYTLDFTDATNGTKLYQCDVFWNNNIISQQKKVSLPAGIESNKEQLMAFINEHKINSDILGKCPCCKEGDVYRMEHGYKCNVSTCTFVLWNNNIERFFKNFSKNISEEILPKYIEIMLTKGKCFIDNLYNPKKEDFFNAYISLQFNEKYQNWGLGFAQMTDKQGEETPEQEKECTPLLTDGEKEFSEEPSEAMFFSDTLIQKIFRAVKMRGEYRKLGKKGKADTFIIIDENKLILPTGKDKENPYNILNRIVTESRKFGMALIIVSQRPEHFPEEMLSSIYTKIVLRINENDVKAAANSLGVKDPSLFKHLNSKNVALVGYTGGLFESVELAYSS